MYILVVTALIYFGIGVLMTAFCVHMSYHEAAIGFGDSDDFKVQKVLESKIGPLGMIFLFTCWPLALLIAFRGKSRSAETPQDSEAAPVSAETHTSPHTDS